MVTLTSKQMKQMSIDYYSSVSKNKITSVRKSGKFKNCIVLKVFNPIFNEYGNIWVKFNFEFRQMSICTEYVCHAMREF
jgi:hypothetical protein